VTSKVLLLAKGLGRGGAERIVVDSAISGDRSRFAYEVAYLVPQKRALVDELAAAGVPALCLGRRSWPADLRRLIRDRGVSLVHAHAPVPAIGARVSRLGVPIVYTEHNLWQRYRAATRIANAATFPSNRHVFCVSDAVRDSVRYPRALRRRRMPPLETLYHGPAREALLRAATATAPQFGPAGVRTVGCVANFKAHKGHTTLIQAFAKVRANVPNAHLVLVGVGPTEASTRRLVHRLDLEHAVTFAGRRDDVPAIMNSLHVFVLASEHEGLPISLLEAMALGVPSVVTAVGGIPEIVRGRGAILVPPGDSDALADQVVRVLDDQDLRDRLSDDGRRRAVDFDISNAVRRMETVYEKAIAASGNPWGEGV
jgi:glycosyltransferase involved in cell wall biosynthesis